MFTGSCAFSRILLRLFRDLCSKEPGNHLKQFKLFIKAILLCDLELQLARKEEGWCGT